MRPPTIRRAGIALALATGLFATACGSGDPTVTPPDPTGTPTDGTTTPAPTGDPTTPDPTGDPTSPDPTTPDPTEDPTAGGDCSAAGMSTEADFTHLTPDARQTVDLMLNAAVTCDVEWLVAAAYQHGTHLSFGDLSPEDFFALPDDGRYATLVTLLTQTQWAAWPDDSQPPVLVWPRVAAGGDWADSDEAWQEPVAAGLIDAARAQEMRESGIGYIDWRVGVDGNGAWMFFVAGD